MSPGYVTKHSKIHLVEGDKFISCKDQIAKKFTEYFTNIPILNMRNNEYYCPDLSKPDPIWKILDKYRDHASIKLTRLTVTLKFLSLVKLISKKSKKSFQYLDPKKATQKNDIKTNLLQKNAEFFGKGK